MYKPTQEIFIKNNMWMKSLPNLDMISCVAKLVDWEVATKNHLKVVIKKTFITTP